MDGKGAWRDNVFVERLWRTVKYEGECQKFCVSRFCSVLFALFVFLLQRAEEGKRSPN
jgi:hypothetical protein